MLPHEAVKGLSSEEALYFASSVRVPKELLPRNALRWCLHLKEPTWVVGEHKQLIFWLDCFSSAGFTTSAGGEVDLVLCGISMVEDSAKRDMIDTDEGLLRLSMLLASEI